MEEREAGREWPMSTCHSLVPPACPQELTQTTLSPNMSYLLKGHFSIYTMQWSIFKCPVIIDITGT